MARPSWLYDEDTLKDVLPVGVLVLLLGLRVLGLCCCASTSSRARARRRVHLVIVSLVLGLGCAAAALLLESSPGSVVWPPPPRAIAAAAAWGAVWPIAALVGVYELRVEPSLWRRRAGLAWPESLWHVVAGRLARAARLHVVQNPVRSDHPSCQSHQHQAGALPGAMPKLQGDQRASKPLAGRRRESG